MYNLVCYFENDKELAEKTFNHLANGLINHGVDVVRMVESMMIIDTPHFYISFVTEWDKLRNRNIDKIVTPEETDADGLLNYILQEEGM